MPGAYGLLNENFKEPIIGGAELQFTMIAKKLTEDFDISFVVYDHDQKSPENIESINIFKSFSVQDFPKKKYLKIVYSTFKALRNASSDVYLTRSGRVLPAIMALYCFINRKKFVYSFASDMDVDLDDFGFLELILFRFALKKAELLITSGEFQKKRLKEVFGKDSIIIKNAFDVKNEKPVKNEKLTILWVSNFKKEWKNPELYLELAKKIPDIQFLMIGGPNPENPDCYNEIKDKSINIPNLEFIGFVPYNEIGEYFSRASVFVNTSNVEGFPNTFLQAFESYTPILSLKIDPDEIICNHNLGFHSKTIENMVNDLKKLIGNKNLREKMGENGRKYVEREHDINKITNKYKKLLKNLINT